MHPTPILQAVSQYTLYLMQLVAVWIFFRGHNLPGGGFIGGLMAAAGIVLLGLAFGFTEAQRIYPFRATNMIASGLLLIVGTGVGGMVLDYPFLTHAFDHTNLPFFGDVEWATAAIFDLGVMLTVVGATKSIIFTIAGEEDELGAPAWAEDAEQPADTTAGDPDDQGTSEPVAQLAAPRQRE